MLDYSKSFIETQFPVSKISKESYKERKAGASQTLTGLGKWWGRKPLILVRATLLGVLMPVSDNPEKDKEIFLKILTMDEEGLWKRKTGTISDKEIKAILSKPEIDKYFNQSGKIEPQYKEIVQLLAFNRLSYDDKLKYCVRPEQYELLDESVWTEINEHLETNASNLQELIEQLGIKKFGHRPIVGDAFAGGGSIPFEAARMGADVYASDLNPIAGLLNWASLFILGASKTETVGLKEFQEKIFEIVQREVDRLGIEINETNHHGDAYLYCAETVCPECGWKVPLAPNWVIGTKSNTIALLKERSEDKSFDIEVIMDASPAQSLLAESQSTIVGNKFKCAHCSSETPITSLRNDEKTVQGRTQYGISMWGKGKFIPDYSDVYNERLYAIRYANEDSKYYTAPTNEDIIREKKVIDIISDNFVEWQYKGFIPDTMIENGYNTDQPIRERGWNYWHHLFNPRMLLIHGLFMKAIHEIAETPNEVIVGIMGINSICNWDSKLAQWINDDNHINAQTFYNQAFNTMYNYSHRPLKNLRTMWFFPFKDEVSITTNCVCEIEDARKIDNVSDVWITDPPYADAVNYHELTEFFLAWDKSLLEKALPNWYADSKRVLAVKGVGNDFNQSMIDVYRNLSHRMHDDGYQVVMFTHQDVKVWAELAMILWSAGLHVVSAWNIATETEATGIKRGNYVKGTVLLTLKKQTSDEIAFQDELYDEIKYEVKHIIDSMKALDDKDDPDFTDADYLLASYAASLKVLTAYREIDGIDVEYWLAQPRDSKEENPIEALINKAVRIAYDYLIPEGFDNSLWKDLRPEERFYIRGLEVEMSGVSKISSYQELARGFGVSDYADMFANFRANTARLKTPSEYRMTFLNGEGFSSTLLRHLLVAINETTEHKSTVEGRAYLKNVYQQDNAYWYKKPLMVELLSFIANLEYVDHMKHWHEHAYSAKILKEALKNEGV